ncbi:MULTISPECIES: sensor histidine kinase [unclassified Sporolactobacillus]|uniref:sensor histidine kinase n=1 Tax=unclassified Sporolactobacillus TaxID=2628533 RepID=UPI00236779DA|nr:histidine kinase [Sporolactobacillus sp. CQH2019]MDD9149021.1 histidine kinase [Sporolactobacillus sp. CQH2019]
MLFYLFEGLVFCSVVFSILSFFLLISLPIVEKEINVLELENTKVRLQNRVQESELLQLSRQIQPHFMFNTLNVILSLARLKRQEKLIEGLERFSMYLRYKYTDKKDMIPFSVELNQIKNYIYIQKLRFGRKLSIDIQVNDQELSAGIPPYTLQILVENAFKHAFGKNTGNKRLSISLERKGNWVELRVTDNGSEPLNLQSEHGIGLENIRKRLRLLFDLYTEVRIEKNADRETVAKVVWPYTIVEDES